MNRHYAKLHTLGLILLTLIVVVVTTDNRTVLSQQTGGTNRVAVKFREGSDVRLRAGQLTSLSGANLSAVQGLLQTVGVVQIERLFQRPEVQLQAERQAILTAPVVPNSPQAIQRSKLADLNLFYVITLPTRLTPAAANQFVAALKALPNVEDAYFMQAALPPPEPKLQSTTPLFVNQQFYLNAPGLGVDAATYAWSQAGGKGAGVTIVDIEYDWNFDHEDLPIDLPSSLVGGEQYTVFGNDHGTSVLGIMSGNENSFGVTGLAPQATLKLVGTFFGGNYSVANAVNVAAANSAVGDIILVEQQWGPPAQLPICPASCTCGSDASRYMPVEEDAAIYAAISNAVAAGRIVVIAAGNGFNDLDWSGFGGRYNRNVRDSGAIYVGAGFSGTNGFSPVRAPHCFSNHGTRVDVQGIGDNVFTTGGGDAFSPDANRLYTSLFSGTSSSSPIVAGSAAILQGIAKQRGFTLNAWEMRDLLRNSGQPQASSTLLIGPRPDLRQAIAALPAGTVTATPTNTAAATATRTATATVTNTPSRTNTPTATNTATNTATSTPSATNTPSRTNTPTATNTATNTPSATNTATHTPSRTNTPTYTFTATPSATNTPTATPTNTNTATNTATHTPSRTNTPTHTFTATSTATNTVSVTATNTPSATNTVTFTATGTASATASLTPSFTATVTYTPSVTNTASATPTSTLPTATPSATPSATANFVASHADTIGIFRTSSTTFYLRNSNTTGIADSMITLGSPSDFPIVGDWNGDGIDTTGVFRPATGEFFLTDSTANPIVVSYDFVFGVPGDQPIVGDWDGDGKDNVGVYRPSNGLIFLRNSLSTGIADYSMILGSPGDIGLAGDWDGDGKDSPGVYRPSNHTFYVVNNICNCPVVGATQVSFGGTGDIPFVGDWNSDGVTGIGVYRPSNGTVYLKNVLAAGGADITFVYGSLYDYPVAGRWAQAVPQFNGDKSNQAAPTFQP